MKFKKGDLVLVVLVDKDYQEELGRIYTVAGPWLNHRWPVNFYSMEETTTRIQEKALRLIKNPGDDAEDEMVKIMNAKTKENVW